MKTRDLVKRIGLTAMAVMCCMALVLCGCGKKGSKTTSSAAGSGGESEAVSSEDEVSGGGGATNATSSKKGNSKTSSKSNNTNSKSSGKKTELVLWSLYEANGIAAIQTYAKNFVSSHPEYKVKVINMGNAVDIRRKMATLSAKEYPALFCGTPSATCYYENLDYVKPLQDFLDADTDNWENSLYPNVKRAYSNLDGKMIGAPFGMSCGGYYVNTTVLDKLVQKKGDKYALKNLTTYEKIIDAAIAAHQEVGVTYGISFGIKSVDLADLLTLQGVELIDQNNGYGKGTPSKTYLSDKNSAAYKATKKLLKKVAEAYQAGAAQNFGTGGMTSFYNGNMAFQVGTNSNMIHVLNNANGQFKWDFIPFPGIDDSAAYKGVALTEGTGLYITNSGNKTAMQGAYEFVKFLAQPENQAAWATVMGYVPYTDAGFQHKDFVAFANKNCPSLLQLPDKMKKAPAGLRLPYTYAWDYILDANDSLFDKVSADAKDGSIKDSDIDGYIKDTADTLTEAIQVAARRYKK